MQPIPSPIPSSAPSHSSPNAGFSLVEVVLAIGLVMFAALVIFSLMPVGMASLQESNRQIIETEIYNTVGAELASTPFNRLTNYQTDRFPIYFDIEGIEVNSPTDAAFTVRASMTNAELGAGELQRIRIKVGFRQDPDVPGNRSTSRTFLPVSYTHLTLPTKRIV